jgi:hypothetical protein
MKRPLEEPRKALQKPPSKDEVYETESSTIESGACPSPEIRCDTSNGQRSPRTEVGHATIEIGAKGTVAVGTGDGP